MTNYYCNKCKHIHRFGSNIYIQHKKYTNTGKSKREAKRYKINMNIDGKEEIHIFYIKSNNKEEIKKIAINNFTPYNKIKILSIKEIEYPKGEISYKNVKKIQNEAYQNNDWKVYFACGYTGDIRNLNTFIKDFERRKSELIYYNIVRWNRNVINAIKELEYLGFTTKKSEYDNLLKKAKKIIVDNEKRYKIEK